MENRTHAFAVGIFALLLTVAMLLSFWWLSGDREAHAEYVVVSKLPVTGLNTEAVVKFRGVDVGKVTQISLDPASKTSILVNIEVTESLQLSKEAYAELRLKGVTGLAYVELNDVSTSADRLKAGEKIPLHATLMDRLLDRAPVLISQVETLLKTSNETVVSVSKFLNKIDSDKLNKALANLERATAKLDPLLSTATITLNRVGDMASEKHQIQFLQTMESIQKTAADAQPMLEEVSQAAQAFRSMSNGIELTNNQLSDKLNHETLPQLQQLTYNLNQDALHFGQLLELLQDNPQSLIFGAPEPMPGPGEPGFKSKP
jgi:phospholipid/cholesterol/gamma-HCH transport system substrate-binding protein